MLTSERALTAAIVFIIVGLLCIIVYFIPEQPKEEPLVDMDEINKTIIATCKENGSEVKVIYYEDAHSIKEIKCCKNGCD